MRTGFVLALCMALSLFAEAPLAKYLIDPTIRGADVAAIVTLLNTPGGDYFIPGQSEVVMQVRPGFLISPVFAPGVSTGVAGGFVPFVSSVDAMTAPHGTLLIVTYFPPNRSTNTIPQYLVVPVEQVAVILYSSQPITLRRDTPPLSSLFPVGVLPQYNMDPIKRATDLVSVFTALNTKSTPLLASPYDTGVNTVGIFTTLSGPYNPQISGGFIPDVQSITAFGAYLLIQYQPLSSSGFTFNKTNATIVVTAEQVIQLVYYAARLPYSNGLFPTGS